MRALILALSMMVVLVHGPIAASGRTMDPKVKAEIEAVIHDMAGRWAADTWTSIPDDLWDPDEPTPMYLAEEQAGWLIGWDQVRGYFNPQGGFMEAASYEASNIQVRQIADDLAVATWNIYWQMKGRRMAPIGERLRANGIFRRTGAGWKFIHYGEAPKSPSVYMQDLYAGQVSPEFKARVERLQGGKPAR